MKQTALFLLLLAFFTACNQGEKNFQYENYTAEYIKVDSTSAGMGDPEMLDEIRPYRQKLDSAMGGVIAYTPKEYFKKKPNGTLNNISCDMVFSVVRERYKDSPYRPDMCLLNYGGLRRPIPKGKVSKSDIFQLMPFQNESVICRLNGKRMLEMFEYIGRSGGEPVANVIIYYNKDRKFDHALIDGQRFDPDKTYNVLTSDYTAKGGNHMDFFAQADTMILCGTLLRNDMFSYIENLPDSNLVASDEKRIIFE